MSIKEFSQLSTAKQKTKPKRKAKTKSVVQPESPSAQAEVPSAPTSLPIVGIGASAGGLEAFELFFRACPADTGMAFVLVPHLDPGHDSMLSEILQRSSAMPVVQAVDQIQIEPDHVYIIPPNREMAICNGTLLLSIPAQARGHRMPIDAFLRSLAEDQGAQAMGVILSGTATDGTLGLRAIFGAGGVCMVQEPTSAKYDGMPSSAIAAGYATHILPVEEMPAALLDLVQTSVFRHKVPAIAREASQLGLTQILLQVRKETGHDFSQYKKNTIGRRIERRMAKHNISDGALYARFLKENRAETQALFKELLINVTSFFRDPEVFVVLKQTMLPRLLESKPEGYEFRVWVAGCASGEEAYSIAIVLLELQDELVAKQQRSFSFQIYATDLDSDAIDMARNGHYPPNISQDITPERLLRYFSKDDTGYKVKQALRERVVFAVQNAAKDPPFSRLDLLSCRNLMIYLDAELQNRLIINFHYALNAGGVLLLSASESIPHHTELFSVLDRKWRFYEANRDASTGASLTGRRRILSIEKGTMKASDTAGSPALRSRPGQVADLSQRALLQTFAPASATTDVRGNILYVHGDTGKFLRPAPGPVTNNVVEMAREGLQRELRAAILSASTQGAPTLDREVSMTSEGGSTLVTFSVRRLPGQHAKAGAAMQSGDQLLLVSFAETKPAGKSGNQKVAKAAPTKRASRSAEAGRIDALEHELNVVRENLQATEEAAQATSEEFKSANEELQSANEELQSTNEEMETSREELQSLNEEIVTVNSELTAKLDELTSARDDIKNLMENMNGNVLFLDSQLMIRRYTRNMAKLYRLIPADVGRPLSDIQSNIEGVAFFKELQAVLDTLIPREREVRTQNGMWYLARMQPYRTQKNVIDGVVLTFTDVSKLREAERIKLDATKLACELAEGIFNTVQLPLLVLNSALEVVTASRTFYERFRVAEKAVVGRSIFSLGNGEWDIPALRQLLEEILPREKSLNGFVVEHDFPQIGVRRVVLDARRIVTESPGLELILLAITQVGGE